MKAWDEVKRWRGHRWYPTILTAHILLTIFIPGYRVAQIKSKYGWLRYYVDRPLWWGKEWNYFNIYIGTPYFYFISDKITGWAEERTYKMEINLGIL